MQNAIVIGATSGIGKETAKLFAKNGYRVGIAGRRLERLEELRKEISTETWIKQIDVTQPETAIPLFQELASEMGGADVVVLSSGIVRPNPDLIWQNDRETITTNVLGFAAMADAAATLFRTQKHGHLVGISSVSSLVYSDRTNSYCASKAFVSNYLRGLRISLEKSEGDYSVTEILPGWVRTEMTRSADPAQLMWITTADKAAEQICDAIAKRKRKIFISRKWHLIACLLAVLPERYRLK